MLYFGFKNYEEFKALFEKRVTNNGKVVRSNGILLSFLKHEFANKRFMRLDFKSVDDIVDYVNDALYGIDKLANGFRFYHTDYRADECKGICEDGDVCSVRYVRKDNERVFKMKAGKFYRKLLEDSNLINHLNESTIIYVCERFAEDWRTFVTERTTEYTLYVNDDFESIYDPNCLREGFNSCMIGDNQWSFYRDAVKAKAAYLMDKSGWIVARCVIFQEVHDTETGEILRLAERQYAMNEDNVLKHMLVSKLIEGGYIDGYKRVGVDCHNKRAFVLNDGTSLQDRELWIECNLEDGDTISYQDSFKHFEYSEQQADNYGYGSFDLATTDSRFNYGGEVEDEWDEFHEYYCAETETVYVWRGSGYAEMSCNVNDHEGLVYCDRYDEYYDEAHYSEAENDYVPFNMSQYCEFKDDYMFSDRARYCPEAEDYFHEDYYDEWLEEWEKENWEWDEYNCEYVENTFICYVWDEYSKEYEAKDVEVSYAEANFFEYEGEWYNEVNEDGIPYDLVEELEAV